MAPLQETAWEKPSSKSGLVGAPPVVRVARAIDPALPGEGPPRLRPVEGHVPPGVACVESLDEDAGGRDGFLDLARRGDEPAPERVGALGRNRDAHPQAV